jgi:hypothetical protein
MVFQLDEGAEILGSLDQDEYPLVPALPGYGITRDTPVPQKNLVRVYKLHIVWSLFFTSKGCVQLSSMVTIKPPSLRGDQASFLP